MCKLALEDTNVRCARCGMKLWQYFGTRNWYAVSSGFVRDRCTILRRHKPKLDKFAHGGELPQSR